MEQVKRRGAPPGSKHAIKPIEQIKRNRSIKTTDADWEIIQSNARSAGMSASAYIRKLVLTGVM